MQVRAEGLPQAQGYVGIFRGVAHGIIHANPVKGDRRFPGPQKGFDRNWHMAEISFRQGVHPVAVQ